MIALGGLAQALLGVGTLVAGLAGTQTSPASMAINIGPGSIYSLQEVDANAYGGLGTNVNPLVKQGVNLTPTSFTLTAPGTSGQSINYLIEAEFVETDTNSLVLPYYNPASPSTPFAGPNNLGASQNTTRTQRVGLQLKAGAAATTGTQTTPATDTGWVPLYVITVNYGQTTITTGQITVAAGAPFIPFTLSQLASPSLLSGNGWKKYPDLSSPTGYFIEQWGSVSNGGSGARTQTVTLPIPFPTAFLNVVGSDTGANCYGYGVNPATLSTFSWNIPAGTIGPSMTPQASGSAVMNWQAKGY